MKRALAHSLILAGACLIVAAAGASCGRGPDREVSRRLQEAQAAFLEAAAPEDYLHVAALYQEVLDGGFVNGAVLFNQGNAFMRAGKKGRAVAAYRRAERYRARDPNLAANLELALGRPAAPGRRTLLDHFFFWQRWLSYAEKFRVAAAAGGLALLFGLWGLLAGRSTLRRSATLAALFLTTLLSASAALDWYRYDVVGQGVVVAVETVARKGNAESFASAFSAPLKEGTEFTLREDRGDWLRIRLTGGLEGWIRRETADLY
jgi:hypothetical protein